MHRRAYQPCRPRATRLVTVLAVLTLAGGLGCSGDAPTEPQPGPPAGPTAGTAGLSLTTPSGTVDVALRMHVRAGVPLTLTVPNDHDGRIVASATLDGALLVIFAPFPSGRIASVGIPNVQRFSLYTTKVEEVAAADYTVRSTNLTGYTAALELAP